MALNSGPNSPKRKVARPIIRKKSTEQGSPEEVAPIAESPSPPPGHHVPSASPITEPPTGLAQVARPILATTRRERLVVAEEEYDETEDVLVGAAKRSAPAWLISLGVHTCILVVLGLLMLPGLFDAPLQIEVVYAEKIGKQVEDEIFQSPTEEIPVLEDPVLAEDIEEVEDPLAAPPEVEPIEFQATTQTTDIQLSLIHI